MSNNDTWFHVSDQIAYKYHLHNDSWTDLGWANATNNSKGLAAATDPTTGLIYIVNGININGTIWMQQYNTITNSIGVVPTHPNLQNVISFAASWSTYRKTLLVHGGTVAVGNVIQRSLYEYVPSGGGAGKWTILSDNGDVPPGRQSHCMVPAYGGSKMVIFGGIDQSGEALGDVYILDMETLRWTKGTEGSPEVARGNTVCAVTNDLFVAWGGCDSNVNPLVKNLTVVYNMMTGTWQNFYAPIQGLTPPGPGSTNTGRTVTNIGGIVGGVVGGVAMIVGVAGFLFYRRKKAHQKEPTSSSRDNDSGDAPRLNPNEALSGTLNSGTVISGDIYSGETYLPSNGGYHDHSGGNARVPVYPEGLSEEGYRIAIPQNTDPVS
jgi:hypothetical protein